MVNQVDIVIPSYNGRQLLELHLPDVIKFTPNLNKLIIIEDGGDDDTSFFLKTQYPQATLIRNPHNLGFTNSVINGIALCSAPNIVLINNDVSPQKNYLKSSLSKNSIHGPMFSGITVNWVLKKVSGLPHPITRPGLQAVVAFLVGKSMGS